MNNLELDFENIIKLATENDVEIDVIVKYAPFLDKYHQQSQSIQFVVRDQFGRAMSKTYDLCNNYNVVCDKYGFMDIKTALKHTLEIFNEEMRRQDEKFKSLDDR